MRAKGICGHDAIYLLPDENWKIIDLFGNYNKGLLLGILDGEQDKTLKVKYALIIFGI